MNFKWSRDLISSVRCSWVLDFHVSDIFCKTPNLFDTVFFAGLRCVTASLTKPNERQAKSEAALGRMLTPSRTGPVHVGPSQNCNLATRSCAGLYINSLVEHPDSRVK